MINCEIVAAKINNTITNSSVTIKEALELDLEIEFLSRQQMQFMAACDLGIRWEQLSQSKTLFIMDQDGNPQQSPRGE